MYKVCKNCGSGFLFPATFGLFFPARSGYLRPPEHILLTPGISVTRFLREQCKDLTRCLEDGRLELSNNRAERSIKPFVMGRKNRLFANTSGGAQASSVIYSLIETAKENGLDPYRYLLWLLQNAPQLSETDEAWAEKLLPAKAPKECYMPHK